MVEFAGGIEPATPACKALVPGFASNLAAIGRKFDTLPDTLPDGSFWSSILD
jgi:hypothetical protein